MISKYEFTLKEGPKMKMKKILDTKSWRNFLEGLKQKVNIFIGIKTNLTKKNAINNSSGLTSNNHHEFQQEIRF